MSGARGRLRSMASRSLAFCRDRRGVSALEFALLAPLLIMLYFGATELAQGMMAQRRVSHAASTIGDLLSQEKSTTLSELSNIFSAAADVVSPFPSAPLQLRLSSVTGAPTTGKPSVDWSQAQGLSAWQKNAAPPDPVPSGLINNPGDNVIVATAQYQYTPIAPFFLSKGLTFKETFYLHPRQSATVTCSDCP